MTLLQFRPVDGRLDEILSMLMHSREVASHPSLSYAIRLVSEEIIDNKQTGILKMKIKSK